MSRTGSVLHEDSDQVLREACIAHGAQLEFIDVALEAAHTMVGCGVFSVPSVSGRGSGGKVGVVFLALQPLLGNITTCI